MKFLDPGFEFKVALLDWLPKKARELICSAILPLAEGRMDLGISVK